MEIGWASMNSAPNARIEVENGIARMVTAAEPNKNLSKGAYDRYDTVEKVFDSIQERANSKKKPYVFNIDYDEALGYPKLIFVDQSPDPDDESRIRIYRLEPKK